MRIDKWLWCARFYKTRSLATQAVDDGKVKLDDQRIKPAREIRAGNRLHIQIGEYVWHIEILALASQRNAAPIAQGLYREDADSVARRQLAMQARRGSVNPDAPHKGHPSKRDRRQIHRFLDAID
jgi:ribosome-associated heat shock protein Hsp15